MGATAATAMTYEDVKSSGVSKTAVHKNADKVLDQMGTVSIFWYLLKKHNKGLWMTWGVVAGMFWLFPVVPDLVFHFVMGLFK